MRFTALGLAAVLIGLRAVFIFLNSRMGRVSQPQPEDEMQDKILLQTFS
jgi:hypothetical protein